ncbi:hypothetical protein INT47_013181 [Mucor saturninus]|uniref:Uncharacterized protein n=1 Tax=Mucor saturninus TaxID=64648 RepID=A0A8H7QJH7_9FUNG|nr:hypothetical protein INT47_013181 [Mucor saturninus]
MIDWSNLSPVHVRVDIAMNFFAVSAVENRPVISFVKEEFCSAAGKLFGGEGTTSESHDMCLGRFGGMSAHNPSPGVYEAFKVILYNDVKIPFTRAKARFNGAVGEDWSPAKSRATIAHASGHWRKGVEMYQRCLEEHEETQFTSRLEVRVSAADVDDLLVHKLMDGLHRLQSNGAFVHFFVDEYLGYVRELLVMTTEIMVSLSRRFDASGSNAGFLC